MASSADTKRGRPTVKRGQIGSTCTAVPLPYSFGGVVNIAGGRGGGAGGGGGGGGGAGVVVYGKIGAISKRILAAHGSDARYDIAAKMGGAFVSWGGVWD